MSRTIKPADTLLFARVLLVIEAALCILAASWAWAVMAGAPAAAGEPDGKISLSLPLRCEPGKTCFVQNYVDTDPGSGARDYACGAATYDGHNGIDFRLRSARDAETGVDVVAAAAGIVKATREGERDILLRNRSRAEITGRECGNGVVIDHGQGWESQYCHLRNGSILVRTGDHVDSGAALGRVGYSGMADFAHLHFTVRYRGAIVDPFQFPPAGSACPSDPDAAIGLWQPETRAHLPYATGTILEAGFAEKAPTLTDFELGVLPPAPLAGSPQMVLYVRVINLRAGDRISFEARGPAGFAIRHATEPIGQGKAVYVAFSGRKPAAGAAFSAGSYEGTVRVLRGEATVSSTSVSLVLPHGAP